MLTRGYVARRSGGGGSGAVTVYGEEPAGAIDGANTSYATSSDYSPGTERVYLNGVRQRVGVSNDYVRGESGGLGTGYDTVTFTLPPKAGDVILIDYQSA